ncbi:MAG: hypothetical protein ACK5M4_16140 [Pseudorhodobacter sp.]
MQKARRFGLDRRFFRLYLMAAVLTPAACLGLTCALQAMGLLPSRPAIRPLAEAAAFAGALTALFGLLPTTLIWVAMQGLLYAIRNERLRAAVSVLPVIPVLWLVFVTIALRAFGPGLARSDTVTGAIALALPIAAAALLTGSSVFFGPGRRKPIS